MNAILFLMLTSAPSPTPARVEGTIDLSTLSIPQARAIDGSRRKFIVWRSSMVDEHEGQKHFNAWHAREVDCFIRLVEGQDVPEAERFTVEGFLRVWDVPGYDVNGRRVEGWTMIRVENASVIRRD